MQTKMHPQTVKKYWGALFLIAIKLIWPLL